MTLNEYQQKALRTAGEHINKLDRLNNAQCGLCGEAGEFADLYKKFAYQHAPYDPERFMKEAGDCLWYIALAADALGTDLETIAPMNVDKLLKRYPDGYDPIRANNREKGDV